MILSCVHNIVQFQKISIPTPKKAVGNFKGEGEGDGDGVRCLNSQSFKRKE